MGNVTIERSAVCTKNISIEHSERVYWLGRYTERAFTTMKSLERLYDKVIDRDPEHYKKYLDCFGMADTYGDYKTFFRNFVFDKENTCSAAYNLERAYDNGIVLREEISTEAFAYLQLAIDTLEGSRNVKQGLKLCLMPLEDILYSFFGCFIDHVFNDEIRDIFLCAKSLERLELYIRLKYKNEMVLSEFGRLCGCLERIPENTPYRYNPQRLEELSDIINSENGYSGNEFKAVAIISRLFEEGSR